jgi:hypothetical protein
MLISPNYFILNNCDTRQWLLSSQAAHGDRRKALKDSICGQKADAGRGVASE